MKHILPLFFTVLLLCATSSMLSAQWVQVASPYGGVVRCFVVSGTYLFAGTNGGVFRSTNNATNWTPANAGLTNFRAPLKIRFVKRGDSFFRRQAKSKGA